MPASIIILYTCSVTRNTIWRSRAKRGEMAKFLDKYQSFITIGLIMFIAIGGIILLYQQQNDKVTMANNAAKVQQANFDRQKEEMANQLEAMQKQLEEQKQKTPQPAASGQVAGAAVQSPAVSGLININTADLSALDTLPGIGPSKAQTIIDYRNEKGPFKSINDLKNVKGIGDSTFQKLKSKITI